MEKGVMCDCFKCNRWPYRCDFYFTFFWNTLQILNLGDMTFFGGTLKRTFIESSFLFLNNSIGISLYF